MKITNLLFISILLVVTSSSCLASNFIDDFYGVAPNKEITVQQNCLGNLDYDLTKLSQDVRFTNAINIFEDGFHVINFTGDKLNDMQYITINKEGNEVELYNGICSNDYHYYEANLNLVEAKAAFSSKDKELMIKEGYNILENIKGLSFIQKCQIIWMGVNL